MSLAFEEQEKYEEIPIFPGQRQKFIVTKNAVPGFICQMIQVAEGKPPITAASKAYASLCFGNERPNLIISSEARMKHMLSCFKDKTGMEPAIYGWNVGFLFMNTIWTHPANMGFEINDDWVFMLNSKHPTDFRLNGCYRPMPLL